MAVAFDAVGPSSSGTTGSTSPVTWSHNPASGAALLVGVVIDNATSSTVVTATFAGTSMTLLSSVNVNAASNGFIYLFGLANVAAGTQTVSVSFNNFPDVCAFGSVSFTGAASTTGAAFGTPATGTGASGSETVTVSSTSSSSRVAAMNGDGGSPVVPFTWSGGTNRWSVAQNSAGTVGSGGMADGAGTGGSVTITMTADSTDSWAMIGVEVLPPPANTTVTTQPLQSSTLLRRREQQTSQFTQVPPVLPPAQLQQAQNLLAAHRVQTWQWGLIPVPPVPPYTTARRQIPRRAATPLRFGVVVPRPAAAVTRAVRPPVLQRRPVRPQAPVVPAAIAPPAVRAARPPAGRTRPRGQYTGPLAPQAVATTPVSIQVQQSSGLLTRHLVMQVQAGAAAVVPVAPPYTTARRQVAARTRTGRYTPGTPPAPVAPAITVARRPVTRIVRPSRYIPGQPPAPRSAGYTTATRRPPVIRRQGRTTPVTPPLPQGPGITRATRPPQRPLRQGRTYGPLTPPAAPSPLSPAQSQSTTLLARRRTQGLQPGATVAVVIPQQGTATIVNTLAATATIVNTLAGTATVVNTLAGSASISNTLAGSATIKNNLAGTATIVNEL